MKCPRCGNEDPKWFYLGSKGWYCRKCVKFRALELNNDFEESYPEPPIVDAEYSLRFKLTVYQKEVSEQILSLIKQNNSLLVNAVCGAGKTELVYATIRYCLEQRKRVGFAISRRQVVLQLAQRLKVDFPNLKVIPVCEDHTKDIWGDLIICTAHQLYRYPHYFDLLILDEPDAFPFRGNEVLRNIANNSCKGNFIYLSATPDEWLKSLVNSGKISEVDLPRRPSNKPLALPQVIYSFKSILIIKLILIMKKQTRQTLVYFPTIKMLDQYAKLFKRFKVRSISSKTENKEEILAGFLKKEFQFLFCTTILERGITFPGIDVIVFMAQHQVYTGSVLVQIMGRVGRDVKDSEGKGVFLCLKKTTAIEESCQLIDSANKRAYGAGENSMTRKI